MKPLIRAGRFGGLPVRVPVASPTVLALVPPAQQARADALAGRDGYPAATLAAGAHTMPALTPHPPLQHHRAQQLAQQEAERERMLAQERAQAWAQAQAEGHAAGLAAGQAEWAQRIKGLDATTAALRQGFDAAVHAAEDVIVDIAFEATAKVLGQAAPTREGVLGIVRQALAGLHDREVLVLRMAPPDAATVEAAVAELASALDQRALRVLADDRVESGGCLVETAAGGLDARLDTQIARLRDVLLHARGHRTGGPA